MRPRSHLGQMILAVAQWALLQRQAATANAAIQLVAQEGHLIDAAVKVFTPAR